MLEATAGTASLDGRALVAGFPGAALMTGGGGRPVAANGAAGPIARALDEGGAAVLRRAVAAVLGGGGPRNIALELPGGGGRRAFELSVIALGGADRGRALVLGRETTLDKNLVAALTASRRLFRDLVSCSADFAWETDAAGAIGYVSPRGALGYSARALNGRPAAALLAPGHAAPEPLPFASREPLEDVELWLTAAGGGAACLVTSCLPVHDEAGVWVGVRGVCRDVTRDRARERALAGARDRERLLGKIVDAMRNDLVSSAMLRTAAEATAWSVDASHAGVLRRLGGGEFTTAAQIAVRPGEDGEDGEDAGDIFAALAAPLAALEEKSPDEAIPGRHGGRDLLALPTRYRGRVNGAICVARAERAGPWSDEAEALLRGVAAHLGIGLEQMRNHETLERLSRTDDLTGLLNRRAFFADVTARLRAHNRAGRPAAVLYLDLDNFKQVNDGAGHDAGDAVLKSLSEVLARGIRAGDQAARFGGDEFALWLEETGAAGGAAKAEALLAAMAGVRAAAGRAAADLNLSIGVAVTERSRPETLHELIARADRAMYAAKRAGKGTYRGLAPDDEGA